jgi:hypothetical protein
VKQYIFLLLIVLLFGNVFSQEEQKSADEIARNMSNPTLPMFNLALFYDYQNMTGNLPEADNQSVNLLALQPPLPFPLKNGKNLLIRPLISFNFAAPEYPASGFQSAGAIHFGDIPLDILIAGTSAKGFMFGYGLVANIPSGTSNAIRGEWRVGPNLLLGKISKNVFVLVLNNSFQLSGNGEKESILGGQYVAAFSLGNGWQFVSSPPFSYNWNTNAFTLPIGGGPFRTILMGETPIKIGVQFNYFITQADAFGPKWGLRFNITPSLKRPW